MKKIINVLEGKTHLSRLLDRVRAGEEIILAKNGRPYARLVPIEKEGKRLFGFMKGTVGEEFSCPSPKKSRPPGNDRSPGHPRVPLGGSGA